MGINLYKEHLVVYLEDEPYRGIINGSKMLPQVNANRIDVKPPVGGWKKVLESVKDEFKLLENNPKRNILLLIDFNNSASSRKKLLNTILQESNTPNIQERIFIFGIDCKESEDLKTTLNISNWEKIGQELLKECPHKMNDTWHNKHLKQNITEVEKMKKSGVFSWLFQ